MPSQVCGINSGACFDFETTAALNDIKCLVEEWGADISIRPRTEKNVARDAYGSIKRFNVTETAAITPVDVKAYPLNFSPTQRDIDKAGLKDDTEVIAWIPRQYFIDANIEFDQLDMERITFLIQNKPYEMKDKAQQSQIRNEFLYYVFGLAERS